MSKSTPNLRAQAAQILCKTLVGGQSLASALPKGQAPLLQELCFGVCRHYFELQAILNQLLSKPLKKKDADVEALLLVGLYQLLKLDLPDHAVLNETVAATKTLKKIWAKSLVNAILRKAQRESESLPTSPPTAPEPRYNHPLWLINWLKQAYPGQWERILDANQQRPPMWLRVNVQQIAIEDYLEQLNQAGMEYQQSDLVPEAILLIKPCPVSELPGFAEGLVSVQDLAAQLAAHLLDLQPELTILDACAAPGGKTIHILENAPKIGELVAIDSDCDRIERIHDNLKRLKWDDHPAINVLEGDASQPENWAKDRQFDRILLDAPCSATGVIRRHPDIKLLRRETDIPELCATQKHILDALWPLLKPGGILLYATCSVLPEENQLQMSQFLQRHSDAEEVSDCLLANCKNQKPPIDLNTLEDSKHSHTIMQTNPGITLLPSSEGHDGFYYAKLRKQG